MDILHLDIRDLADTAIAASSKRTQPREIVKKLFSDTLTEGRSLANKDARLLVDTIYLIPNMTKWFDKALRDNNMLAYTFFGFQASLRGFKTNEDLHNRKFPTLAIFPDDISLFADWCMENIEAKRKARGKGTRYSPEDIQSGIKEVLEKYGPEMALKYASRVKPMVNECEKWDKEKALQTPFNECSEDAGFFESLITAMEDLPSPPMIEPHVPIYDDVDAATLMPWHKQRPGKLGDTMSAYSSRLKEAGNEKIAPRFRKRRGKSS